MRKTLMAALLAIVMCLAALSGCAMVRGFEKDVQVVLMVTANIGAATPSTPSTMRLYRFPKRRRA